MILLPAYNHSDTEQRQEGAMIYHDLDPAFRLACIENAVFTVRARHARTNIWEFKRGECPFSEDQAIAIA